MYVEIVGYHVEAVRRVRNSLNSRASQKIQYRFSEMDSAIIEMNFRFYASILRPFFQSESSTVIQDFQVISVIDGRLGKRKTVVLQHT